jgi:hypothetical protein
MLKGVKKIQPSNQNKLTLAEVNRIFALYSTDPNIEKLELEQLQYITTDDIYEVCSAYESLPISRTEESDWNITRGNTQIDIKLHKDHFAYHIDLYNGNVFTSENGRLLGTGCNASVVQVFLLKKYAIPIYFGVGHWGHRRLPFELGIAVPKPRLLNKVLNVIYNRDIQQINDWYADKLFLGIDLQTVKVYNDTIDQLCAEHKININKLL